MIKLKGPPSSRQQCSSGPFHDSHSIQPLKWLQKFTSSLVQTVALVCTASRWSLTSLTTLAGLSLVNELAAKNSDISIFAGVRNPSNANSLEELSKKYPGKITIVKYISADEEGNKALAKEIEIKNGHLDAVIACAGQFHTRFPLLPFDDS